MGVNVGCQSVIVFNTGVAVCELKIKQGKKNTGREHDGREHGCRNENYLGHSGHSKYADKNVAKDFFCVRIFYEFHILIEVFIVHILGPFFFPHV